MVMKEEILDVLNNVARTYNLVDDIEEIYVPYSRSRIGLLKFVSSQKMWAGLKTLKNVDIYYNEQKLWFTIEQSLEEREVKGKSWSAYKYLQSLLAEEVVQRLSHDNRGEVWLENCLLVQSSVDSMTVNHLVLNGLAQVEWTEVQWVRQMEGQRQAAAASR